MSSAFTTDHEANSDVELRTERDYNERAGNLHHITTALDDRQLGGYNQAESRAGSVTLSDNNYRPGAVGELASLNNLRSTIRWMILAGVPGIPFILLRLSHYLEKGVVWCCLTHRLGEWMFRTITSLVARSSRHRGYVNIVAPPRRDDLRDLRPLTLYQEPRRGLSRASSLSVRTEGSTVLRTRWHGNKSVFSGTEPSMVNPYLGFLHGNRLMNTHPGK